MKTKEKTILSGTVRICSHNIEWWVDASDYPHLIDEIKELPETDFEHIQNKLNEDYIFGELCITWTDDICGIAELYGWWTIVNN